MTLRAATAAALAAAGLDPSDVERVVRDALAEDLRCGPDVTTVATVPAGVFAAADVTCRAAGVVAGVPVALAVLDAAGVDQAAAPALVPDGARVGPGDVVAAFRAELRGLLTVERTMLNLLTHLSGIATATRAWVDAVSGTSAEVRDTRKTLPGLRALEKYAVRCGGGANHRMGLGDAVLIKDNHVVAAGGIAPAIRAVRAAHPDLTLEVECDTLDQVGEAIAAGATLILLDNMDLDGLRAAVTLRAGHPEVRLEASGGLTLATARAVAETGVDYLAVGALTHSSPVLDLGLDVRPALETSTRVTPTAGCTGRATCGDP